jgi:hypothetical protein
VIVGVGESLANIVLGLAVLVVARVAMALGSVGRDTGAHLADPHAP